MRIATVQPEIFNMHLVSTAASAVPGRELLTSVHVRFGADIADHYGGTRSTTSYDFGSSTGIQMRAYLNRPAERAASQGVLDAIRASGLLTAELPPNDFTRPAVGRTRLYLDKRAKHLEFDMANPPAIVRPILDALAAYELVARRGVAAA